MNNRSDFHLKLIEPTTGILITNLGTPEAPNPKALCNYLKEFLSDPRIVDLPRWLWWLILHLIILPMRSRYSANLYKKIWTVEGSPLLVNSKKLVAGIQKIFDEENSDIKVVLGMRYGAPSIASALNQLYQQELKKLIVLPLYPQYSSVTTASTTDAVTQVVKAWNRPTPIHFIDHYADNTNYIAALATSITEFWRYNGQGEKLLFSFHGVPQKKIDAGDPYYEQCVKTVELIVAKLKLPTTQWDLVFQSRFGRQRWLKPYCHQQLQQLAREGIRKVDVICPGFSADCLETLEEICQRNHEIFLEAGGEQLRYIPALNDSKPHLHLLVDLIKTKL